MSFLGNLATHLTRLNESLSPTKRWGILVLLVVAVMSLVFAGKQTDETYVELFAGRAFNATELVQVEQAFASEGLSLWRVDGSRIRVPASHKATYLSALQGIINADSLNADIDKALENSSLWEPRHVKDLKIKHAEEKQLSRMLAAMKYIDDVTVRKDEIQVRGLRGQRETTALAAVKPAGNLQLDGHKAHAIRNAVAACYAGLDRDQVTVLDLNSGRVFGGNTGESSSREDTYALRKRHFEQLYQDRIRTELAVQAPGVTVEIYVALNYLSPRRDSVLPVTPSASINSPSQPAHTDPTNELVPEHVVASITLPAYQQVPPVTPGNPPPLNATALRERVVELLKIPVSSQLPSPSTVVHVHAANHTANSATQQAETTSAPLGFDQLSLTWLGWILFLAAGIGLFAQRMRRKTVGTDPAVAEPANNALSQPDPPPEIQVSQAPTETSHAEDDDQLRFQLTDRIRKDPDTAVHVLKHWLDDAA